MFEFGLAELMLFAVIPGIFLLTALCDLTSRQFPDVATKIIWAIAIFLIPYAGPILYLRVGTKQGEWRLAPARLGNAQSRPVDKESGSAEGRFIEAELADPDGTAFAKQQGQDETGGGAAAVKRCPNCRAALTMGRPTCPKCGLAVRFCPTCQVPTIPTRPVCPQCGARLRFSRPA
jgi:rRNA maturation protein Nop10